MKNPRIEISAPLPAQLDYDFGYDDDDEVDFVSSGPAHPTLRRNLERTLLNQLPAGVPLERAGLKVFFPEEQDEVTEEQREVQITSYGPAHPLLRRNLERTLLNQLPAGVPLERADLKVFFPEEQDEVMEEQPEVQITSYGPAHPTLRRNLERTLLNKLPAGVPLERAGLKVFFPEEQDEDIDLVEERPEVHITAYGPAPPSRRRNMEQSLMTLLPRCAELERAGLKVFLPSNDELDGGVTQKVEEHDDDDDV